MRVAILDEFFLPQLTATQTLPGVRLVAEVVQHHRDVLAEAPAGHRGAA